MKPTVAIGVQDYETIRTNHYFYIDKTDFIRQWWEAGDSVTLLTRPRRFGKTLMMSMVEEFFSVHYASRTDLFDGTKIWEHTRYRELQGTYPVIFLSFANVKEKDCLNAKKRICQILTDLYIQNAFLQKSGFLQGRELEFFESVSPDMDDTTATLALHQLAGYLCRYYKKKVIILLDEYDTPLQEAYVDGYWEDFTGFIRNMFNAAFKTNPHLERAIMTGITRISKESIFSDLNNLEVVTTTSEKYEECFGFTEREVFDALDEFGFSDRKQEVKDWYDGFLFGRAEDIYNPWSILNFLDKGKIAAYWANTSSNSLIGELLRKANKEIKQDFELLLKGGTLVTALDEQIVYDQLDRKKNAIWSLLLASGYLKVMSVEDDPGRRRWRYHLALTNTEVHAMFESMIEDWFTDDSSDYNDFIAALLQGDVDAMNVYMNRVSQSVFSFFDTGSHPSGQREPERFYHGFVLGLVVELQGRYEILSNRESGFGRYDVMLRPRNPHDPAMILEFKVFDPRKETDLCETAGNALVQIAKKQYAAQLEAQGIAGERIRSYGFAFRGKEVLIR